MVAAVAGLLAWSFVELDEAESTQAVARGLASGGSPEGTVVTAKSQSSGVGRLGRPWASPVGGLYMSVVLRPGNILRPELAALVSAVAVVRGVEKATALRPVIRWPNDVLVRGKKLAGVIAEAQSYGHNIASVVIGIGVNCNAKVSGVGAGTEATSTSEVSGRREEIPAIRNAILDSLSELYEDWKRGVDVARQWHESIGTIGKQVLVRLKTEGSPFSCVARAVDQQGNLVVERDLASVVIRSEDLEWLREEE